MFDLHCHILPGLDDGASSLSVALDMARRQVDQGVEVVACTPHILPGVYANSGSEIVPAVSRFQEHLGDAGIPLQLVSGADNHISPNFVADLQRGHLLPINGSRYVLVEPPHHNQPPRLEAVFWDIIAAGHVPILTHPERLEWINVKGGFDVFRRLHQRGVGMQVTAGSLTGRFGKRAKYWAERLVCEGLVDILASDAHNLTTRPPDLDRGARAAEGLVGQNAAHHMVVTAPKAILENSSVVEPPVLQAGARRSQSNAAYSGGDGRDSLTGRLRRAFGQSR
ncbi:MAG: CpsB/CapC family capsule biosynthesis tyrosine phosphatase [Pseudomonadota bacterium]